MDKDNNSNAWDTGRTGNQEGFHTIFDDVFRTIAQKMPFLLIPLINEVFQTTYSEDQEFEQLRNEHYETFGKIITDSIIRIEEHLYHMECQSQRDGAWRSGWWNMILRSPSRVRNWKMGSLRSISRNPAY